MTKKQIEKWRKGFIFLDHDVNYMTDEDIKKGIANVAKTIGSFGATTEEAATAVRALGSDKQPLLPDTK